MRAVIQRVSTAAVWVDQEIVSSIGRGICVLVGLARGDSQPDIDYVVRRLVNTRLFDCPETGKRWDKSVKDLGLEILCVSQFTLHATFKGNKLDFHKAMPSSSSSSSSTATAEGGGGGGAVDDDEAEEDEIEAAAPKFYAKFMAHLQQAYNTNNNNNLSDGGVDVDKVKDGRFGAMMRVHIVNDGPVTLTIDSRNRNNNE